MRRNKITALMVLIAVLALGAADASAATKTTTIHIEGMKCNICSASVTKALRATAGVEKVEVSFEKGEAIIQYDDAKVSEEKLREVINGTGFKATEGKSAAAAPGRGRRAA